MRLYNAREVYTKALQKHGGAAGLAAAREKSRAIGAKMVATRRENIEKKREVDVCRERATALLRQSLTPGLATPALTPELNLWVAMGVGSLEDLVEDAREVAVQKERERVARLEELSER